MTRRRRPVPFAGFKLHRLEDRVTPAIVADVPTWRNQGPFGAAGTVADVAAHPTDPNIVFVAGASGGLWRTFSATSASPSWDAINTDNGTLQAANATAQGLGDRLPSLAIADLDLNPQNPNELVFGLGDVQTDARLEGDLVGLYTTSNALAPTPVFTRLTGPKNEPASDVFGQPTTINPQGAFVNNSVRSVVGRSLPFDAVTAVPSTVTGYILAASDTGIYLAYRRLSGSVDEFTRISGRGGLGPAGYTQAGLLDLTKPYFGRVADIVPDPSNPKRVYIADNLGVFRTDDLFAFAPASDGAVAKFPTFADLTPALTAASGSLAGTLLAANAGTNQRVRVSVHASTDAAGRDVNALYVAVVNPGVEKSQAPPNDDGSNPVNVDGVLSVFFSTDQLQKFDPTTGAYFRTDRAGNYTRDAAGNSQPALGFGMLTNSDGTPALDAAGNQLIGSGVTFGSGTFSQMDEPLQLTPTIGTVTDATYANPISVTIVGHGLNTGDRVVFENVAGNAAPNTVFTVTRTGKDAFTLNGSAGTGKFILGNSTARQVYGAATASIIGASLNDIRLDIAADPVDPNLVYIGGGTTGWRGTFVGDAYPTYSGASLFRGDRRRPRLNGLISTELISNDVSFQWTALNGYKAAFDADPSQAGFSPSATGPFGRTLSLEPRLARNPDGSVILNPDGSQRTQLLTGNEFGVYVRDNPRANGQLGRNSPADAARNVWTDLSGSGPSGLSLAVSDGFNSNSLTLSVNGVTTKQGRINFAYTRQLFDPVSQISFNGDDVDGVTTPGVSHRSQFLDYQTVGPSGVELSRTFFSLSTPTDAKFGSALIQADKNNSGFLVSRFSQTRPTNPGSTSSGAGRVLIAGVNVYEDDFPDDGIGNIVGNITPAGMTGVTSALTYGGRQPGAVVTVDGRKQVQYVETARVVYLGTTGTNDAGQLFVRPAIGGFRQVTTLPGTGIVNDIVTDPDDWRIAYVLRNNSQIYRTLDAGLTWSPDLTRFYVDTDGTVKPLAIPLVNTGAFDAQGVYTGLGVYDGQGNVADGLSTQLFSLGLYDGQPDANSLGFPVTTPAAGQLVQVGAVPGFYNGTDTRQDVLLVGGKGGVYRLVSLPDATAPANTAERQDPVWNEFGVGLPNVPVTSVGVNTYTTADTKGGVTFTTRRAGLTVGTRGRGTWDIGVPDRRTDTPGSQPGGLFNDIAPTASAPTVVGVNATDQTTGAATGGALSGIISADPNNTAFVTVSDGLGNTRTFERTVIQGFGFTGTSQADTVTVQGVDPALLASTRTDLAQSAADLAAARASLAFASAQLVAAQRSGNAAGVAMFTTQVGVYAADVARLSGQVSRQTSTLNALLKLDLTFVRFPVRIDLLNTLGDSVRVVNGQKTAATVATVDTVAERNQFGDLTPVQTLGGGPADNLFNTAAGGKLTVSGLALGTFDVDLGARADLAASLPADQVFVAATAAANTVLRVGANAAVVVASTALPAVPGVSAPRLAGSLDGLLGGVTVVATPSTDKGSLATLTVTDTAGSANPNASIGRETRADGQVFGNVAGVGGPNNLAGVLYQNVASLAVNGSDANAPETFTINDPSAPLVLDVKGGPNTVNVQAASLKTTVLADTGNDLFRVSSRAGVNDDGDLSRITGVLTLDAGGGNNRLVLSNAGSALSSAVTITRAAVAGASAGAINYRATGGRFLDPAGGPGVLYRGSNQTADQVRLLSGLSGSQYTLDGLGGADTVTVVGDDLAGVDVLVRGGGGDNIVVSQGRSGLNAASVRVAGDGTDGLTAQGFDLPSRTDNATLRVDGGGAGAAFVDGGSTAVQFTGLAAVGFDGLSGRNNLNVLDNTGTAYGSAANPGAGIVYAPSGEFAGTVRLGGAAPAVRFANVNGADDVGLVVFGDPNGPGGDTLTVVGPSEPGLGALGSLEVANAANTITVTDRQVVFERSGAGPLRSIALGRVNDRNTFSNLVVLAGNQARQGDTVAVAPSSEINILVDGQGPARGGSTGNVLTVSTDQPYTLTSTASPALGGAQTRVEAANGGSFGYRGFGRIQADPAVGVGGGGGRSVYAVGADVGGGPRVRVYDALTRDVLFDQFVYEESFTGGVRVATGDVTGDGIPDLVVAAGPGGGPRVSVYDGVTFKVVSSFFAYEKSFTGGLYLAVGDLDGNGQAEIVTGTGVGGGPLVKSFDARGRQLNAVFAFESTFRGGVRVAVGDVTGDGLAELVTTAGPGGGPVVRVFDSVTLKPVLEYFAADSTLRTGLAVAAGDLTGDGVAEIIVAPASGPVSAATVRRGDGSTVSVPLFTDQGADPTPTPTGTLSDIGGARLATADSNATGTTKVFLAARGPGFPSKVYRYFIDPVLEADSTQAFEDSFVGGVWVG